MDDSTIVQMYWDRDERAIFATAHKYGNYCASIAVNILGNNEDVEECLNDTYLNAWNTMPPHKPNMLSTFLGKITRNISLNKYNRNNANKRNGVTIVMDELSDLVSDVDNVEQEIDYHELIYYINSFLASLPAKKRKIFICRYWYFDSISAISSQLGMTENNVSVTLTRIRTKLRNYLLLRGFEL